MVRHLSRSTRQRTLVAAVAFALAAGTALVPAAQADDLKHKKHKVERSIKGARANLEESSNAAYQARRRLDQARTQLDVAQQKLASTRGRLTAATVLDARMQAELVQAREDLDRATTGLEVGIQRVKDQRATVGRYAADASQRVDPQLLGLVAMVNADNPSDLATQMKTAGNIMNREHRVLEDLRQARTLLKVKEQKVQAARDAVAVKRKAAADNLVVRQQLERQAADDEQSVSHLVAARAKARRTAAAAKASDQAELGRLKKENDRIAAILAARARHSVSQGNGGPLLRPTNAYVTSPFGWRVHPIYGYRSLHDGTDFAAGCGTPLLASGNGTVVSEYFQTAWGNRLIVDLGRIRGHGVSVIYNHLSGYRVGAGAHVTRGETVGLAGTTGWSTGCHLHFTVMVDGVAQDPMSWF
ncbi:MAG: peptidoglycan DD-metalloendopeptidase family protein [Marmoricola sp.]